MVWNEMTKNPFVIERYMLMRATSEGILLSINIGYFEFNDIPYIINRNTG